MNEDDLIFKIKNEQINNEVTKIELNLRLNEVRGFSTTNDTNDIVNCTPISQVTLLEISENI